MSTINWETKPYDQTYNKQISWLDSPHPSTKFGDSNPKDAFFQVIEELGNPTSIDKRDDGVAIWNKETLLKRKLCWERVELKDEQIPHLHPAPHVGFLYFHYKLAIPINKFGQILALSESVFYDRLKGHIIARCDRPSANIATIYLALMIATGKMSGKYAKDKYAEYIMSTIPGTDFYKKGARVMMEKELYKYCFRKKK